MKKTQIKAKLTLQAEIVRRLPRQLDHLHAVVGGDGPTLPPTACPGCRKTF